MKLFLRDHHSHPLERLVRKIWPPILSIYNKISPAVYPVAILKHITTPLPVTTTRIIIGGSLIAAELLPSLPEKKRFRELKLRIVGKILRIS